LLGGLILLVSTAVAYYVFVVKAPTAQTPPPTKHEIPLEKDEKAIKSGCVEKVMGLIKKEENMKATPSNVWRVTS